MEIVELRDEHVPGVVRLLCQASPHQLLSEEGFRHGLASTPAAGRERRWVALDGGEVVGAAGAVRHLWADRDDVALVGATVRADRRGHGLGGELAERVLAHARAVGAARAVAESGSDDGVRFLERRGFERTNTRRYSQIDPRTADLSGLGELRARAEAAGYALAPFAACRPEDVHAVDDATTPDVPADPPLAGMPYEDWRARYWEDPLLTREGSVAVLHEGRPVTIAVVRVAGDRAMNDMTGTLREHRGRGLARLVKLASLEWAARNGVSSVVTENDETNAAMLAVNARLGYRLFHEVRSYAREPL